MEDIRLAIGLMGFLSVAVVWLTLRLARSLPVRFLDLLAVGVLGLMALYLNTVWGKLWIVKYIPLSSVIVLSNWFPLLLAALGAIVWVRLEPVFTAEDAEEDRASILLWANVRRCTTSIVLIIAGVYSVMFFIPRTPPECGDEWFDAPPPAVWPVCHQTTKHTCSAAASATILNTLGIEASEQEMARLCLTRSGTTWLGLYHGLSTKLLYTDYRTDFFEGDISSLEEIAANHPALLCCRLDPDVAELIPEYVTNGGWIPGTAHSVVYFGKYRGLHIIGDPSVGYEAWGDKDLSALWTGQGLRITRKKKADPTQG